MAEKHLTSFDAHLTAQYSERGTPAREEFEEGFATFRISVTINELQKEEKYKPNLFEQSLQNGQSGS